MNQDGSAVVASMLRSQPGLEKISLLCNTFDASGEKTIGDSLRVNKKVPPLYCSGGVFLCVFSIGGSCVFKCF